MPSESSEAYSFGDVVLVPFPFTHQAAHKKRPAVVVSGAEFNRLRPDLVMRPITSQLRAAAHCGEVWIGEWEEANLLKPSAIKPHIATLGQTLVIKRRGRLQPLDILNVRAAIAAMLG